MLFSYFLGLPLSLSLVRPPRTTSSHLASLRLTSPHHPDSLIFQAPRKWVARISSGICPSYRKYNPRSTNEVIPHSAKGSISFTYPGAAVQLLEKFHLRPMTCGMITFGGDVAILHCPQEGPKGKKKQRLHARGRSPPCSVFSMEHPVRWIMTVEICMARLSGVEDRYSFRLVLQHTLTIYVRFLLFLDSRTIISSPLRCKHPTAIFCPLSRRRKKKENHQKKKKKVKEKRKRKENSHAPFQSHLGTQMFPSLHKLNGFTSRRHLDIL